MGTRSRRFVCKAIPGEGWRIWDTTERQWWGNMYAQYPTALLVELNGQKRPNVITALSKGSMKPKRRK